MPIGQNEKEAWYQLNDIDQLDTPALVVYLDRVKHNIELVKSMIDDVQRLRPHVKTHKTKEATLLLLQAGISKFKCATIAEAEMLAQVGAPDVLLAYQPVGPKVQRFISLIKRYPATRFSCLVDDLIPAQDLSQKAIQADINIPVYIDLNVGMNRTGITPNKALQLYRDLKELQGITLVGLHAYDGHIGDTDLAIRTSRCDAAFDPVLELKEALIKEGFVAPIIIAGGSPTFPIHAKRKEVECSPGTFIYWDAGYAQQLPEQPFLPAALVITRVVSHPAENLLCADLGHKSVAAENPLNRRVVFINAPELVCVGQSEEHLVLQAEKGHHFKIGNVLYGMPIHICPTCALYEKAFVVEGGNVTAEWKMVARDRKINT